MAAVTISCDFGAQENKRCLLLGRKAMTNLDSIFKSRDITLPTKVHLVKAMAFPVVIDGCELDHKESWVSKNWCFWTVGLEDTLESPLNCKEIQPVHPKGNQSWIFTGRTDAEAETPNLWPPDVKNWLIWKGPDSGKDWRWEKKGMTEDEMAGWHPDSMDMNWVNSGSLWWTVRPGMLQSMGSQRVRHNSATELNWTPGVPNGLCEPGQFHWLLWASVPPQFWLFLPVSYHGCRAWAITENRLLSHLSIPENLQGAAVSEVASLRLSWEGLKINRPVWMV